MRRTRWRKSTRLSTRNTASLSTESTGLLSKSLPKSDLSWKRAQTRSITGTWTWRNRDQTELDIRTLPRPHLEAIRDLLLRRSFKSNYLFTNSDMIQQLERVYGQFWINLNQILEDKT